MGAQHVFSRCRWKEFCCSSDIRNGPKMLVKLSSTDLLFLRHASIHSDNKGTVLSMIQEVCCQQVNLNVLCMHPHLFSCADKADSALLIAKTHSDLVSAPKDSSSALGLQGCHNPTSLPLCTLTGFDMHVMSKKRLTLAVGVENS